MRSGKFILFLIVTLAALRSFAQPRVELTQSRILILLDGSSSMIHKWAEGKEKFKAAGDLIGKLMDSVYKVNDQVEFSLRVFGHQHTMEENYCFDTKNEVPFAKDNRLQMALRLDALQPLGVTPIAYALQQAAEYDLTDEAHNAYSIILITDGGESCGGDICEVMRTLIKNKVFFKPYILSLEDDPQLKTTYACMGDYLQVTKNADIPKAVGVIVDAFRPVLKITPSEYKHLQNEVAKTHPADTAKLKAIKTFKEDTIITNAAPVRPPADLVTTARVAKSELLATKIDVEEVKEIAPPTLPPLVYDRPAPLKMSKLIIHQLSPIPVKITSDISPDNMVPLTGLPPVKKEMPEPMKFARISPHSLTPLLQHKPGEIEMAPFEFHSSLPPLASEPPAKVDIAGISLVSLKPFPVNIHKHIIVNTLPKKQDPVFVNKGGSLKDSEVVVSTIDLESKLPTIQVEAPAPTPVKLSFVTPHRQVLLVVKPTEPTFSIMNLESQLPKVKQETPAPIQIKLSAVTPHRQILLPVKPAAGLQVNTFGPDFDLPALVKEVPHIAPSKFATIAPTRLWLLQAGAPAIAKVKPMGPLETLPPIAPEVVAPAPVTLKMSRLKISPPMRFNLLIVVDEKNYAPRPIPPLPPVKKEIVPKTEKTTATKPALITIPPEKRAETKVETEDAKETTLEVYFTNGKGKFYQSTPQVVLVDPVTNKDVKSFYRFIDAEGNPDPQKDIPTGTFNITFSTKRSLVAPNIVIEKNKRNKVYVTVKNTSLTFQYASAPGRPVSEYVAVVTERNKAQGRVQKQKCTEKMEYEPENYHIEVNTFPTDVRNVDLDFDLETVIIIPQPGFGRFTNDVNAASVVLYFRDGDKFKPFATINPADPKCQHLPIQPGEYQAHYSKGPVKSYGTEQVLPFTIRTTEETEIRLK